MFAVAGPLLGHLASPSSAGNNCASIVGMDLDEFRASLADITPPAGLGHALEGLWWDGKGEWTKAHESAQQDEGPAGSWVHAYLHRKEGDAGNARYWYGRAGKFPATESLEGEWLSILQALLAATR